MPFEVWYEQVAARQLARVTFQEARRAVGALSSLYVARRQHLAGGTAWGGAGKRAAQALFFGPLHLLLVRRIVAALAADRPAPATIADLGCGTGAAGAAWALEAGGRPRLAGTDLDRFAVDEARWTYRSLGLRGRPRVGRIEHARLPGAGSAVVAAFAVNELDAGGRDVLLPRLLGAARTGARVLIVEPVARGIAPWWGAWSAAFVAAGGRADEWRFPSSLPPALALLDRAAGLDHRELTARSLYADGRRNS